MDLELVSDLFVLFRDELLVARDPRFALGVASSRCHANPLELLLKGFLPLGLRFLLSSETLLLLLEPGGVVALERNPFAAIELQNPAGYIVQEVSVVRNGDHCARRSRFK